MTVDRDTVEIQGTKAIIRDLHHRHLAGMLGPIDRSVRRVLDGYLRRGLRSGESSPEERALAADLGITDPGEVSTGP